MTAPTVGVEEEYQLVDPDSGELRSRAGRVLEGAWTEDLEGELQETMLEIQTPPCASIEEVRDHLLRRRLTAAATAAAEGLEIVAAGTHPFSVWRGHRMAEGERAAMLERRFGHVARTEHIFGTHLHVALPDQIDPARLMTALRWLSPLLLALSASSPFFEGDDTGYASYRYVVQRRLPLTGPPPALESLEDHERLLDGLTGAGVVPDRRTVYWNLRLNPQYPTLEFRSADACPSLDRVVALAALVRAAVVHVAAGDPLLSPDAVPETDASTAQMHLELSEWQAARFGLAGRMVVPSSPPRSVALGEELARLTDLLRPTIERLGDQAALPRLADLVAADTAADRIRQEAARDGGLVAAVDWLRAETQLGLGRARSQS